MYKKRVLKTLGKGLLLFTVLVISATPCTYDMTFAEKQSYVVHNLWSELKIRTACTFKGLRYLNLIYFYLKKLNIVFIVKIVFFLIFL